MNHLQLLEQFAEEFIETGRDYSIDIALSIVDGRSKLDDHKQIIEVFAHLDEHQKEMLRRFVYIVVDSVIHNVLLMFEDSEVSTVRLCSEDQTIDDMRKIVAGALQGYTFAWAERFSQRPLTYHP